MEERLDDIIERYFRNELTAAEQAEFEHRSASDASFRQAIELHRKALQAIRLQEKANVLGKLSERGRQLDGQKKTAPKASWWLLGAAVLAIAFFCWLKWGGTPSPDTIVTPATPGAFTQDSAQHVPPADTSQSVKPAEAPPAKSPQKQRPIASNKERQERLFAQYFQPFKDETLEPSLRGNGGPSPSEKFQQLYWEGEYGEALAQFENLLPAAKNNDNWLFVKAECLMATEEQAAATPIFEKILANDRSRFMSAASWHLALAYLKMGDFEKAKRQLGKLKSEATAPWREDAGRLLEEIK